MIYKDTFGKTNNVEIIEFGDGSTLLQAGHIPGTDTKFVLFKNCDPGEIGMSAADVYISDDFEPEAALVFKNRKSFELVFDYMTVVKNLYIMDDASKIKAQNDIE